MTTPLSVVWYAGHREIQLLRRSISSFASTCQDSFSLNVVGDGSLTLADKRAIEDIVSPCCVSFPRIEDNSSRREDIFKQRPCLESHYNKSPLAKKIVDIPFLIDGSYLYVDSDVLFYRPFEGVDLRESDVDFAYMGDVRNAYSIQTSDLIRTVKKVPLVRHLNSGFFYLKSNDWIDFDLCEKIASLKQFQRHLPHLEQGYWAALAAEKSGTSVCFNTHQIAFPKLDLTVPTGCVANHFAGLYRPLVENYPSEASHPSSDDPISLKTHPSTLLTPFQLISEGVVRSARRLVGLSDKNVL
jgi:lipopolysaccharide biosynthesis glycosyltransferase